MLTKGIQVFGPVQLTTGDVTEYTSPASTITTLTRAVFTNVNSVAVTLNVNVVRSGGSVGSTNLLIDAYPLSAGQAYVASELAGMILQPGDFVSCKAGTATSINAVCSGYTS